MKTPAVTSPSVTAGRIRCLETSPSALQLRSMIASIVKMLVWVSSVAWVIGLARPEVGNTPRYDPKKSCAISPRKNTGIA